MESNFSTFQLTKTKRRNHLKSVTVNGTSLIKSNYKDGFPDLTFLQIKRINKRLKLNDDAEEKKDFKDYQE